MSIRTYIKIYDGNDNEVVSKQIFGNSEISPVFEEWLASKGIESDRDGMIQGEYIEELGDYGPGPTIDCSLEDLLEAIDNAILKDKIEPNIGKTITTGVPIGNGVSRDSLSNPMFNFTDLYLMLTDDGEVEMKDSTLPLWMIAGVIKNAYIFQSHDIYHACRIKGLFANSYDYELAQEYRITIERW